MKRFVQLFCTLLSLITIPSVWAADFYDIPAGASLYKLQNVQGIACHKFSNPTARKMYIGAKTAQEYVSATVEWPHADGFCPPILCYIDSDGDGRGAGAAVTQSSLPCASGRVPYGDDCDDTEPNAWSSCNTCYTDADNDGYRPSGYSTQIRNSCGAGWTAGTNSDCNDADGSVNVSCNTCSTSCDCTNSTDVCESGVCIDRSAGSCVSGTYAKGDSTCRFYCSGGSWSCPMPGPGVPSVCGGGTSYTCNDGTWTASIGSCSPVNSSACNGSDKVSGDVVCCDSAGPSATCKIDPPSGGCGDMTGYERCCSESSVKCCGPAGNNCYIGTGSTQFGVEDNGMYKYKNSWCSSQNDYEGQYMCLEKAY